MCGVVGLVETRGDRPDAALGSTTESMTAVYTHRGPDDRGLWTDARHGVALGHTRLSVVDVSDGGHQPMVSPSGRYVITYNGEIYGYRDLRREVERHGLRLDGDSDTEVLLASIDLWGLEEALRRSNGMFAFGLWDRERAELHLVRDRLGEKPLCYTWIGNTFLFASDLRALEANSSFPAEIDRRSLSRYLRYGYVPDPLTIYSGVWKLPPGTWAVVRPDRPGATELGRYWSASQVAGAGMEDRFSGRYEDAVDELDALLRDSTRRRTVADVPVGAFLSGGIDSSTIVAMMVQAGGPVRSFTIGSEYAEDDEAAHGAAVAGHLGTDHTEHRVTATDALSVVPLLPTIYDEPFGDPSGIPTYLVSKLARGSVTVALSGDGGDELFGGYNRYVLGMKMWRRMRNVPRPLRSAAGHVLGAVPGATWDRMASMAPGATSGMPRLGDKIEKGARILGSHDADDLYLSLASQWDEPDEVVIAGDVGVNPATTPPFDDPLDRMMFADMTTYLPGDILTKVDRAAMAVSLETRVPFLDHRIVEFAWRLPVQWKIGDGVGKRILRSVLHRYVPQILVDRPKAGFDPPLDVWLRGPLRAWADELLDPVTVTRDGFLRSEPIRTVWSRHLRGANRTYRLWPILMFQAWRDHRRSV